MYIMSLVTGQLALTLGGSKFPGAFSSMLVEVLPLLRKIASDLQSTMGEDNEGLVPTALVAYALCSLLMGAIFFVLAVLRCGFLVREDSKQRVPSPSVAENKA